MDHRTPLSNEQLWGLRPVRWGLQMIPRDGTDMVVTTRVRPSAQDEVWDFLGMSVADGDRREFADRVQAALAARERDVTKAPNRDGLVYANLRHLQSTFDLSDLDIDLMAFRAVSTLDPGFEALVDGHIDRCSEFVLHRKLAFVLGVPDDDIAAALAPSGSLVRKGLVDVSRADREMFDERLSLLPGLATALTVPTTSAQDLLARLLPSERKGNLELSAYPHLSQEIALIRARLAQAILQRAKGVNVLLHGAPGTGKTELAAALARSLDRPLFVAPSSWKDSQSLTPRIRLREARQLQRMVDVTGQSLVLVDEAEDLFPTVWSDSDKIPTKVAVNDCLESNPAPTLWISNRTRHMDEAFLRRFDLVVHVPSLPASAKRELLRDSLPPDTLNEPELRCIASRRELSPAMLTRVAHVAAAGAEGNAKCVRDNLFTLSNEYLRTLGAEPLPMAARPPLLEHDLGLMNADPPLDGLIERLSASRFGVRMLLHGMPGTGKTELGKALAEWLDKPLLQRQASSLLSCWLGGTEQNLREMFDEARREDGILLLDEADSFLRSRDQARARWEVTQTNELLTQMESFEGIFICTTNRLEDIDPAALRRFDFKVAFKPLRPEQCVRLVRQCCAALDVNGADDEDWQGRARHLENLTPGDAAAALRRLGLSDSAPSIGRLLDALADECRYKPGTSRSIGFVQ